MWNFQIYPLYNNNTNFKNITIFLSCTFISKTLCLEDLFPQIFTKQIYRLVLFIYNTEQKSLKTSSSQSQQYQSDSNHLQYFRREQVSNKIQINFLFTTMPAHIIVILAVCVSVMQGVPTTNTHKSTSTTPEMKITDLKKDLQLASNITSLTLTVINNNFNTYVSFLKIYRYLQDAFLIHNSVIDIRSKCQIRFYLIFFSQLCRLISSLYIITIQISTTSKSFQAEHSSVKLSPWKTCFHKYLPNKPFFIYNKQKSLKTSSSQSHLQ